MTKISHILNGKKKSNEAQETAFILTNKAGSFLYAGESATSKFQGYFARTPKGLFRTIESIELPGKLTETENRFHSITRKKGTDTESFHLPQYHNTLCYSISKKSEFYLYLDCRKPYDMRHFGRHYQAYQKNGTTIIRFTKKTDNREDNSNEQEEFTLYIAIKTNGNCHKENEWVKRQYELDKARNTEYERYAYKAARINASKAAISISHSEESALSEANYIFRNWKKITKKQKQKHTHQNIELAAAENAYDSLATTKGIQAGLPWLFQEWSRDTLISLPAEHRYIQKQTIMRYIAKIDVDGRLPSTQDGSHKSSDATGWLFLRAKQLCEKGAFTKKEMQEIATAAEECLKRQKEHYRKEGLIHSGKNETWMDTSYNDTGREGFPIEIQALTLATYEFICQLTKDKQAGKEEKQLAYEVRKRFWNGKTLADTAGDHTARPNIFIAAYAYPKLITKKEWEKCIDNTLPKLWLEWGGLSTIDTKHPLFQPNYTGEDNKSYHRGDSWYWINNLAAITMAKLNRKKYSKYIQKIKEASVNDLLWKGAIGCCSELSSASQQKAEGCLNQAWSCSTLIELLRFLQ